MGNVNWVLLPAIALSFSALPGQLLDSRVQQQDPDAQTEAGTPAIEMSPERRGDLHMARRWFREAIDAYKQAPQTAVIANKIGIAYHQLSELDLAKKQYERALKLNPKYAEAANNLGTVWYAKRSYRRSVNQYRKALKLNPQSASIYSNLGTALFARKKYKEASQAYAMALSLDPNVFEIRGTGGTMLQQRSVEERAKFHYELAKVYANTGMVERALQYIRRSLEEGFKDREKFLKEKEFAALQELPEFQELMELQPRVL